MKRNNFEGAIHFCFFLLNTHENKRLNIDFGGYQSQFLELLFALEKRNDVIISLITKYTEYKSFSKRIKIYTTYKFKNSKLNSLYFFIKAFYLIIKIHKRFPINVIYTPYFYYNMITPLLLRLIFKIPILIKTPTDLQTHQREILSTKSFFSKLLHYGWMNFFKKYIIKLDGIFIQAINKLIFNSFLDLNFKKDNLTLIPNGIFYERFSNISKRSKMENHFGFVGRLVKSKNVLFLLNTFKKYLELYPNDKLFIYGKGPEEKAIINFIKKNNLNQNIIYCGFERNKNKIYSNIDVLILPSFGEGISNTILEAISANTLIIASDIPGNKQIIQDRNNGLLFNPINEKELLTQLLFFKNNKNIIPIILKNAKKKVISDFDIKDISDKIVNFLKLKLNY